MRNVKILNEYRGSSGAQRIFTCLFCIYWMLNVTLGLFIINQFDTELETNFPDFTTYILVFSLKWFTSIGLAFALVLLISLGSAITMFTGHRDNIKSSMIGMALPIYFFCVLVQQIYSTGFGIWFF